MKLRTNAFDDAYTAKHGTDWYAAIEETFRRYARPGWPARAATKRRDSSTSEVTLSWSSSALTRPVGGLKRPEVAEAGVVDEDVDRSGGGGRGGGGRGGGASGGGGGRPDVAAAPGWPRSAVMTSTFLAPSAAHSAATLSSASCRRAVSTSSTPSAARSRAIAAPMPLDAPVTSARLPVSSDIGAGYHAVRARRGGLATGLRRVYERRMRNLTCSMIALALALLASACGPSGKQVATAKQARYQGDRSQIFAVVQKTVASKYKIQKADEASFGLQTDSRWYSQDGQPVSGTLDDVAERPRPRPERLVRGRDPARWRPPPGLGEAGDPALHQGPLEPRGGSGYGSDAAGVDPRPDHGAADRAPQGAPAVRGQGRGRLCSAGGPLQAGPCPRAARAHRTRPGRCLRGPGPSRAPRSEQQQRRRQRGRRRERRRRQRREP